MVLSAREVDGGVLGDETWEATENGVSARLLEGSAA